MNVLLSVQLRLPESGAHFHLLGGAEHNHSGGGGSRTADPITATRPEEKDSRPYDISVPLHTCQKHSQDEEFLPEPGSGGENGPCFLSLPSRMRSRAEECSE